MAGNLQADNSGNILVDFDYNNIIVVDPNKTILSDQCYRVCIGRIYYMSGSAALDHSLRPECAGRDLKQVPEICV